MEWWAHVLRLRLQEGSLAAGWAEVFPELTDGEKKLGQLPGFTPERLDQLTEQYGREVLGLPSDTGNGPVEGPAGNVIATPIPDVGRPSIVTATNPHTTETVRIPDDRAIHILDGDATGGGHRSGTGAANKTEFPPSWTDEKILDAIREVAGTGTVVGPARRPDELLISGEVDGVQIEVVVKPSGDVRTAYPTGGPGVIRNPRW